MVDFHTQRPTMQLADPEDRALLGSNPSAAVGDGDNRRGVLPDAPAPFHISLVVLVRKAINPSFTATQLWLKLVSLTRPVCHLARSPGLKTRTSNRHFLCCDDFETPHFDCLLIRASYFNHSNL